jgi:hypothetical protein
LQVVECPTLAQYSPDTIAAAIATSLDRQLAAAEAPRQPNPLTAGAAFEMHVDALVCNNVP